MSAPKGIKRKIAAAKKRVCREIASNSHGKFGAGLACEGYAGGYRDALEDVTLLLNGVKPSTRGYWEPTP